MYPGCKENQFYDDNYQIFQNEFLTSAFIR